MAAEPHHNQVTLRRTLAHREQSKGGGYFGKEISDCNVGDARGRWSFVRTDDHSAQPSAAGGVILTFQLTDGTVMAQGNNDSRWWRLTPDNTGSYVNGTWTQVASLPAGYVPDALASAVRGDGRLVIVGVPAGMETGASSLVVVTNGIPSQAASITVNQTGQQERRKAPRKTGAFVSSPCGQPSSKSACPVAFQNIV